MALVIVVISTILFAFASVTLWWTMHAWRTPETLAATRFAAPDGTHTLSFSLLLPARHEQRVLEHTVLRLMRSTHTRFEIIIIVGHDDPETAAVAHRLARTHRHRVRVVVDTNPVKNKPRALNTALPYCRGLVIGVFDAEDQVHPDLLEYVDHAFRATGADVVQGGVQLINFHSSWYSLHNCLEYFFWFRSRLHLHADKGFIPLGGNTVFVRATALRAVGSWDGNCLAEDCDLGVRLSSRGAKVVVAYDSTLVTREETPASLAALVRQRTRWNQGFLQVLDKGDWRRLPSFWQRMLARYTLTAPFVQAFSGVVVPLGIVIAVFFDVGIGAALVSFLPIAPMTATLMFQVVGLRDFGRQYQLRIGPIHYLRLVFGAFPYMLVLAVAAVRAVWRALRGQDDWELTAHVGAHLPDAHLSGAAPAIREGSVA
ncbi:glycosyltransferase [Micromonospora sp. WMMD1102]|uniref:glycosyltransferase n=1 Tax=Micromonospora sp. WMMD1102 TaxID=3016105 RepID=UPI002414FD4F|nr:glycosyltransferase [Micromonospora sp. WMMD1102]MDG4788217.1 glycosyltransferase [Micromonospora sp. WMMD1102]